MDLLWVRSSFGTRQGTEEKHDYAHKIRNWTMTEYKEPKNGLDGVQPTEYAGFFVGRKQ